MPFFNIKPHLSTKLEMPNRIALSPAAEGLAGRVLAAEAVQLPARQLSPDPLLTHGARFHLCPAVLKERYSDVHRAGWQECPGKECAHTLLPFNGVQTDTLGGTKGFDKSFIRVPSSYNQYAAQASL